MRPEARRALGDICGHPERAPLCPRELGRKFPRSREEPVMLFERVLKGDLQEI